MPIFEYRCNACRTDFEKLVFSSDADPIECPDCQSPDINKKISAASVQTGNADSCAPAGKPAFG